MRYQIIYIVFRIKYSLMFFYLIHSLPHSGALNEKKRNVRTVFLGIMLYIMFHGILFNKQFENKLKYVSLLKPYFLYIFIADILIMNTLYRVNKGKWLFAELDFNYKRPDPVIVDPNENLERQLIQQPQQIITAEPEIPEYIPQTSELVSGKTQPNDKTKTKQKVKKVTKAKTAKKKTVEKKSVEKDIESPMSEIKLPPKPSRRVPHVTTPTRAGKIDGPTDNSKRTPSKVSSTKQKNKKKDDEIELDSDSSDSEKIKKKPKKK